MKKKKNQHKETKTYSWKRKYIRRTNKNKKDNYN